MEQFIVADADALLQEIGLTGKATVHGIYFDTGKAVVKPESGPALAEVERLLGNRSDMRLFVVGHTDSQGTYEHNLDLSRRRAASVVMSCYAESSSCRSQLRCARSTLTAI